MIALRPLKRSEFADSAPAANPVFYRTYSRKKEDGNRESFTEVCDRVIEGLSELGKFNAEEEQLVEQLVAAVAAVAEPRLQTVAALC